MYDNISDGMEQVHYNQNMQKFDYRREMREAWYLY